ncbi:MAG: hypothetical protein GX139_03545 [Armatimonadetes bacterium]|jgi:hypothetical protein|nr:hypothetical protein [Armatimonadota bacterium]
MIAKIITGTTGAILVFCLMLSAHADPLIMAPTATTLTTGQVRAEAAMRTNDSQDRFFRLGAGLQQFELNVTRVEKPQLKTDNIVGLQWSFLPETSFSPAVAFGVSDAASQSDDGIGVYGVVTKDLPIGKSSSILKECSLTFGLGLFGIRGPLGGFEAKLHNRIFFQGEYDSRRFNGAIGWQPVKQFRLKAYTIDKDYYFGAEVLPLYF